ncbi:MAG: ORF6N domain-containing protein [Bacteroidales bacterium]|nr:ORF6N domain-containing protein [Bacteroidales bacterium]
MCWVRAFFHSIKSNLPYIIKKQPVIIDADVAALYGVEAKRINEPVRNNPNKFPKE